MLEPLTIDVFEHNFIAEKFENLIYFHITLNVEIEIENIYQEEYTQTNIFSHNLKCRNRNRKYLPRRVYSNGI